MRLHVTHSVHHPLSWKSVQQKHYNSNNWRITDFPQGGLVIEDKSVSQWCIIKHWVVNKHWTPIYTKYYLFVTSPVVLFSASCRNLPWYLTKNKLNIYIFKVWKWTSRWHLFRSYWKILSRGVHLLCYTNHQKFYQKKDNIYIWSIYCRKDRKLRCCVGSYPQQPLTSTLDVL